MQDQMESAAISTKRRKQEAAIRFQHNARQTKDDRKRPAKIVSHCTGNSVNSEVGGLNKELLMLEPTSFLVLLLQLNLSSGNGYTNKMCFTGNKQVTQFTMVPSLHGKNQFPI